MILQKLIFLNKVFAVLLVDQLRMIREFNELLGEYVIQELFDGLILLIIFAFH